MGHQVVFGLCSPPRELPNCGVRVEHMPWASGKKQLTHAYAWFLARWARRLSWKEVATVFRASWDSVFRSVEMAVEWGRAHQDLSGIQAIGIDEISRQRGHRYLTLVYQIDAHCKRLLWVGNCGSQGQDAAGIFPLVGPGAQHGAEVRVLRHVETVPEGDRQKSRPGGACAGPFPHHGAFRKSA